MMVKEHVGRRTKLIGSVTHHGDYNVFQILTSLESLSPFTIKLLNLGRNLYIHLWTFKVWTLFYISYTYICIQF